MAFAGMGAGVRSGSLRPPADILVLCSFFLFRASFQRLQIPPATYHDFYHHSRTSLQRDRLKPATFLQDGKPLFFCQGSN